MENNFSKALFITKTTYIIFNIHVLFFIFSKDKMSTDALPLAERIVYWIAGLSGIGYILYHLFLESESKIFY